MEKEHCFDCGMRNSDGSCDCTRCPDCGKDDWCYDCASQGGWMPRWRVEEYEMELE